MLHDFIKFGEIHYLFNFKITLKLQSIGRYNTELITVRCNPIKP